MTPKQIVQAYWQAMNGNDFYQAAKSLTEDCQIHWPQSNELIIGRDNFAKINNHYPVNGQWQFKINSLICEANEVVSDVSVSDDKVNHRAITFHIVKAQLIAKQTEYWPDDYPAPKWRKDWVINQ
ncbi:MAG: nuclear transport factor 2 family protein [Alphaproteobacteria bacterium]|nr:nuclear transport factor 2 family protein [Alphaproteobacteria bacterium]